MKLYDHQKEGLEAVKDLDHVAFYWDMGLGKTFAGSEKMLQLGARVNLVVCQKSKVQDWLDHFDQHYDCRLYDLTNKVDMFNYLHDTPMTAAPHVGVINYDLLWRRPELKNLQAFTLLLDESSLIQNESAKRTKFILKMQPKNVILLSGTPTGGKYEKLWSQMRLLGWNISKDLYWKQFVNVTYLDGIAGNSIPIVTGYKNVPRLKRKMAEYGCQFLKTDEVFDMPAQTFQKIRISTTKEYRQFRKDHIVVIGTEELVGDTTLTKMLYERMLCSIYNQEKLQAFEDLVAGSADRIVVFYNFNRELGKMSEVCKKLDRPYSVVNGSVKHLDEYEHRTSSVTFVQYQAGAMGLNLQKANKIIYYSLPLSSELYEQSKKRIHRIGQDRPCFYYQLICKGSIEEKILATLDMRQDYTEKLFEKDVPSE